MNIATRITVLRILLVPVFILFYSLDIAYGQILSAVVFLVAAVTDFLDGYLARSLNQVTNLGKFLDPIADKLLVTTAFVLLVADGYMSALMCIAFLGRDLIVDGMRMMAAKSGKVVAAGWKGKIKTTTQIIGILFLLLDNFPFSLLGIEFNFGMFMLVIALVFSVWSMGDYIVANKQFLTDNGG